MKKGPYKAACVSMYTSRRLVSAPSLAATFLLLPAARRRSVIRYESLKKIAVRFCVPIMHVKIKFQSNVLALMKEK